MNFNVIEFGSISAILVTQRVIDCFFIYLFFFFLRKLRVLTTIVLVGIDSPYQKPILIFFKALLLVVSKSSEGHLRVFEHTLSTRFSFGCFEGILSSKL